MRFHFVENGIKMLSPHDRFPIVLSASTKIMKVLKDDYVTLEHAL